MVELLLFYLLKDSRWLQIKLIIDTNIVDRYNQYYFSQHPKAKKIQIEHPYHPSLNIWSIKPRFQMNALKQSWKNFIIWLIKDLGYENLHLDNVSITYDIYHPTKRRTDPDNYTPKFIHDGFVESGLLVDDDREHLHSLTIRCHVDKDNPRTEIEILWKNEENAILEIKLKVNEVLGLNNTLKSIIDNDKVKINVLLKFKLLGIMRSIESHILNFEIVKNEKIIEYGEETENGVYQISKDKSESIENFKRDIEQVLNSEVTININLLKPDEVFDQGLSSEYLMGLYPIIGE